MKEFINKQDKNSDLITTMKWKLSNLNDILSNHIIVKGKEYAFLFLILKINLVENLQLMVNILLNSDLDKQ